MGVPTYNFAQISQKLLKIERIWNPGDASPFRSTNDRVHDEKLNYSTVSVLTVVVCCSFTLKMGFSPPYVTYLCWIPPARYKKANQRTMVLVNHSVKPTDKKVRWYKTGLTNILLQCNRTIHIQLIFAKKVREAGILHILKDYSRIQVSPSHWFISAEVCGSWSHYLNFPF